MTASALTSTNASWHWLETQLAGRRMPPVLTLIGLGDGSLLEAIDRHSPATKALVIEPGPVPARTAAATDRMRAWISAGRLVYLTGPDYAGADQAWRVFPAQVEAPRLMVHPSVQPSDTLKAAVALLKKIVFGVLANAEARRRLAPRYLVNSLRNLPAILAGRDVRALAGCAQGVPAVVIGAGPSLDQSIDELKRVGHRAFIIATDTSLRPLLLQGITPHVVIALDPSDINGRHLLGLPECRHTWLVAESALDPMARAQFAARTLWFRVAPHQPWPWLNTFGVDAGRLDVWGSVLTGAYQVAALAGCDPIILVGADLSYPDGRPYARGTTFEYYWAWQAACGTPVDETWRAQLAERAGVRTEPDLRGVDTPTTGVLIEFRDWLVRQARASSRRVINATGRGMLFGDGIEQGTLSEVLAAAPPMPRWPGEWATGCAAAPAPALLRSLRDARQHLADGRLDTRPLADWVEFTAGAFDPVSIGHALDDVLRRLDPAPLTGRSVARPVVAPVRDVAPVVRLPEALLRLRSGLHGEQPPSEGRASTSEQQAALLVQALDRLTGVVTRVSNAPDLVSGPDPARVGDVPAGAIGMWPEVVRWSVLEFEGMLGEAWDRTVPASEPTPFAAGRVAVRQLDHGATVVPLPVARPYATYSCLLLVLEWTRCAASGSCSDAAWPAINARLRALEQFMRPGAPARAAAGPFAELVIEASDGARTARFRLPLGVSEALLARVMTGTTGTASGRRWELGATTGTLSVRVAVETAREVEPPAHAVAPLAPVPRVVALEGRRRLTLAGQLEAGALCVVPLTTDTVVLTPDGRVAPYQTWPRPITGALSLGARGDVAWNHAWESADAGARPYLMYRETPDADVTVIPLAFRPAQALWWRDRLYLTSLPTARAKGGVGSWAPGEPAAAFQFPNLTLQGLVAAGDALHFEPYVPGPADGYGRRRAQGGWTWTPGRPLEKRHLGPRGASSGSASRNGWTAISYPQSDLIVLKGPGGAEHAMRCYGPIRVAWAGESLAVLAGEGDVLLFESLLTS